MQAWRIFGLTWLHDWPHKHTPDLSPPSLLQYLTRHAHSLQIGLVHLPTNPRFTHLVVCWLDSVHNACHFHVTLLDYRVRLCAPQCRWNRQRCNTRGSIKQQRVLCMPLKFVEGSKKILQDNIEWRKMWSLGDHQHEWRFLVITSMNGGFWWSPAWMAVFGDHQHKWRFLVITSMNGGFGWSPAWMAFFGDHQHEWRFLMKALFCYFMLYLLLNSKKSILMKALLPFFLLHAMFATSFWQ